VNEKNLFYKLCAFFAIFCDFLRFFAIFCDFLRFLLISKNMCIFLGFLNKFAKYAVFYIVWRFSYIIFRYWPFLLVDKKCVLRLFEDFGKGPCRNNMFYVNFCNFSLFIRLFVRVLITFDIIGRFLISFFGY